VTEEKAEKDDARAENEVTLDDIVGDLEDEAVRFRASRDLSNRDMQKELGMNILPLLVDFAMGVLDELDSLSNQIPETPAVLPGLSAEESADFLQAVLAAVALARTAPTVSSAQLAALNQLGAFAAEQLADITGEGPDDDADVEGKAEPVMVPTEPVKPDEPDEPEEGEDA
jgi:hypothetical protein